VAENGVSAAKMAAAAIENQQTIGGISGSKDMAKWLGISAAAPGELAKMAAKSTAWHR